MRLKNKNNIQSEIHNLLFLYIVFCIFCNIYTISLAKRTSQKIEYKPVEEEEDMVFVGVPESEPVDHFRETPGISVDSSDSLSL